MEASPKSQFVAGIVPQDVDGIGALMSISIVAWSSDCPVAEGVEPGVR